MRLSVELTEEQAGKLVGRLIPGLGAAVAGAIDYTFLRVAGERAVDYYHNRYLIDHGLQPENPELSLPARAFSVFTPDQPETLPGSLRQSPVVEGSVVAQPTQASLAAVTPARPAAPAVPKKMPSRPPERRIRFWLTIFGIFFFFITIAACSALLILASNGVHSLLGH